MQKNHQNFSDEKRENKDKKKRTEKFFYFDFQPFSNFITGSVQLHLNLKLKP